MTESCIEFVFGQVNDQLKGELKAFWKQHGTAFQAEFKLFRVASIPSHALERMDVPKRIISRQPAAISRDHSGAINGIVFVVLRELDDSLGLGSHAYFQRMYIIPTSRHPQLANQLYRAFLEGFDRAVEQRDYRAKVLLIENFNKSLQTALMRRYFARLGFQMLGGNQLGGEVWAKKLETRFCF